MKTDTKTAHAAFEAAREYVDSAKRTLGTLQQRHGEIAAAIAELEARPAPWPEVIDGAIEAAVADRAAQYVPTLLAHIRARNPGLDKRGSYDDFPFLGGDEFSTAPATIDALCFLLPDLLKPRVREMLLTLTPSHSAATCIGKAERASQLAALREDQRAVDREIEQLQGALESLKGD